MVPSKQSSTCLKQLLQGFFSFRPHRVRVNQAVIVPRAYPEYTVVIPGIELDTERFVQFTGRCAVHGTNALGAQDTEWRGAGNSVVTPPYPANAENDVILQLAWAHFYTKQEFPAEKNREAGVPPLGIGWAELFAEETAVISSSRQGGSFSPDKQLIDYFDCIAPLVYSLEENGTLPAEGSYETQCQ
jgi:hypothetical protein